jgi:TonB family protein
MRPLIRVGVSLVLLAWAAAVHAAAPADDAVQRFVARIESQAATAEGSLFDVALDVDAMLDIALKDEGSAELRTVFRRDMKKTLSGVSSLAHAIKDGGSYRLLRLRTDPRRGPTALFRLITGNGTFNYHEYALKRDAAGVRAVDVYIFINGEWMSDTIRRSWLLALGETGLPAQIKRVAGFESDMAKSGPLVDTVNKLQAAGQLRAALDAWRKLPASIQANKSVLIQRVQIAKGLGEQEYSDALAAFANQFPGDPALDMLLVDDHLNKKQWDLALETMDRIRRAVGGDAYLDVMRANVLVARNDPAAAKAALRTAVEQEPTLLPAYWLLLRFSLTEKKYTETAALLSALESDAGFTVPDLTQVEEYAGFVASDAYKVWTETRRAGVTGTASVGSSAPAPPPPPPPDAALAVVRVGGEIKEPKKLKDVRPVYPDIARQARVQGVVILECTISPQGKVEDVKVLRSIPLLDAAAIEAVKQWEYTPTLLNGVPVPVIMTTTVSFTLS